MRLDDVTREKIINYSKEYFSDFKLYLFGSRVHDTKKGGDIDLFLDSNEEISLDKQMDFLKILYKNVTQKKIDLVVKTPFKENKPIFETARQTGIILC